ncbi:saccharopine dehydrogenase NADP-binding domain-containing protein [Nonomuraea sp. NBC_01738]|uniref:saccharopine dehydrogenase NADP-binding domain-containing protein n=1 Tax=Nonomuraea sp. NBC_01738 TaxID=2976003 RepID=UPI002E14ADF4|nr:saccharopine dehydrogenase NADP-binding domain-containing protein [Nonomuraea sp. NBC_01738]
MNIAVYGATGHTGRLAAAGLRARGHDVILSGRDEGRLKALADELGGAAVHRAALDDHAALVALAERADVLIHCAGPFTHTGRPVALAAAEGGCHYVDHALEQHHTAWMFAEMDPLARRAGIAMVTAMSFYGGFGDLLAGAVAAGVPDIGRLTVAYAVNGWRLTTGAKQTAELLFAATDRIVYEDGEFRVADVEPRNAVYPFPPPLGPRTMIAPIPSSDVVTIPRHVRARRVEAQLTADTFTEEHAFTSEHADPATRAGSSFMVAVQAVTPGGPLAGQVSGRDLWRASALTSVEAAVRLAEGHEPGVFGPSEAFAAQPYLRDLEKLGLFTLRLPEGTSS